MPGKKKNMPELIAPAGSIEKMKTAFAFGADAVYAGIPNFSLRVRVNQFTEEKLAEAIEYAHRLKKKVYVTLNILAHNKHLKILPGHIKRLKRLKPDGVFVSDPGVLLIVKKIYPEMKIILSTQANCTNYAAAEFWQKQGISRVILGREVTIDEIIEISENLPSLELETFVHGAMCMAYSGRCFLSKYLSGRSANLGDCAQPCRWLYRAEIIPAGRNEAFTIEEDRRGSYILNSEDLCLIKRLPEIISAGAGAIKIEGRAKSLHYLATVVGAYRRALDAIYNKKTVSKDLDYLYNQLDTRLAHRGLTEGFMFGKGETAQNTIASHKKCQWEFCGQVVASKTNKKNKNKKKNLIFVKVHNTIMAGDKVEILRPVYDIIEMRINKMRDSVTGEEIREAHGGQGRIVAIKTDVDIPEYSVLRRKIIEM